MTLFRLTSLATCVLIPLAALAQPPQRTVSGQVASKIVEQINDYRSEKGLERLKTDESLETAAEDFARFMARTEKYGHRADDRTPAARAKAAGYEYCVVRENIGYRTNPGEVTAASLTEVFVDGWIDSPPHRENILADYVTETGVGVATTDDVTWYAVQLFGRPRSEAIQVTLRNESDQPWVVIVESSQGSNEIELPPRSRLRMKRCFPVSLNLQDNGEGIRVAEDSRLEISGGQLRRLAGGDRGGQGESPPQPAPAETNSSENSLPQR